jgi:ElaB/YqjD/DUF883 family membrane-anchored ribosome-binding protein
MTDAIALAQAEVAASRARLFATLGTVQTRLSPSNLAQDTLEAATSGVASAARKGADVVRARPVATAAVAGGVGLFLARGWIAGLFRNRKETPAVPEGLVTQDPARAAASKGTQA